MTRQDYVNLLKAHDDPVQWDYPPSMEYNKEIARFRRFVSDLEQQLKKELTVETGSCIQDASFHSQVLLDEAYLRFSNFGDMIATTDDESVAPSTVEIVMDLAVKHGYVFVPHELLEVDYTGINPGVTGIRSWWIRYFDWV